MNTNYNGKTLAEWLQIYDLRPEVKEAALKYSAEADTQDEKYGSAGYALCSTFHWDNTTEGLEYWCQVYLDVREMEELEPKAEI